MEVSFVHKTYDNIASHFNETRIAIWSNVGSFLDGLSPYSVGADFGCGNGKYTRYRSDLFFLATDYCQPLLYNCVGTSQSHDAFVWNLRSGIPIKQSTLDFAICIAVLHHIDDAPSRSDCLQNMIHSLRPGGRMLFTVWAREQHIKSKWIPMEIEGDYLIPWFDKTSHTTFQRYYHLFSKSEVTALIEQLHDIEVESIIFERNNWCVTLVSKRN